MQDMSLLALLKIILIDLVLSGDNAVVIAMAARNLPAEQRKKAIFWGGTGALVLRVLVTAVVAIAMHIPFLQVIGGVLLFWIAVKLLGGQEEEHAVKAGQTLRDAIGTIVMADAVMSLDNMLAVGGASEGNVVLLLMGLALSMGLIMFGSSILAPLMNKYEWIVYVGAGVLGWTAGDMLLKDQWINRVLHPAPQLHMLLPAVLAIAVLLIGFIRRRRVQSEGSSTD